MCNILTLRTTLRFANRHREFFLASANSRVRFTYDMMQLRIACLVALRSDVHSFGCNRIIQKWLFKCIELILFFAYFKVCFLINIITKHILLIIVIFYFIKTNSSQLAQLNRSQPWHYRHSFWHLCEHKTEIIHTLVSQPVIHIIKY